MSFKHVAAVTAYIDDHADELSITDRAFLWGTAEFADKGGVLWPGEEAWQRRTGLSRSGLHKQIRRWVAAGLLAQREPGRRGHRAVYQLTVPTAQQDPIVSTRVDTKTEKVSTTVDTKAPIVSTAGANCVYPGGPLPYRTYKPPLPPHARASQPPLVAAVPGGGRGDGEETSETPHLLKARTAQPETGLHPDTTRVVRELLPELARNQVRFTRHRQAELAVGVSQALKAGVPEDVIRETMLESYAGTRNPSAAAVSRMRRLVALPPVVYDIQPAESTRGERGACTTCNGQVWLHRPDGSHYPCPSCKAPRRDVGVAS